MNSVTVLYDDSLDFVKKKVSTIKSPNYNRVGNGTMNKHKIQSIDLLTELANSTKAGQFLLLTIKNGITYGNDFNPVVRISKKLLTSTEQQYLIIGYKELLAKDLVRRVKNGYYMINPNALIPPDYASAIKVWESCAERNGK